VPEACIVSGMKRTALTLVCLLVTAIAAGQSFSVTFSTERRAQPLDGRLLLLLSTDPSQEPRMQIDDTPGAPQCSLSADDLP
jgi:hypothetical protein